MSEKFDNFGKQIQDVISSLKELREENRFLKEQNVKLRSEITLLENRINFLDQTNFDNCIEIIGGPDIKDEDCVNTVNKIVDKLSVTYLTVINVYRIQLKNHERPRKIVTKLNSKQSHRQLKKIKTKKKYDKSRLEKRLNICKY